MRKLKLSLTVLILFALLFPAIMSSISISTVPNEGALLFQAVNKWNPQPIISELNQQDIQTINVTTKNFETAESQQKDISAKNCYFWDAWIDKSVDRDFDGYHSLIRLRWDADTDQTSEWVWVEIWYQTEAGPPELLWNTSELGLYRIWDGEASTDDEWVDVITFGTLVLNFSLVLFNETGYEQDRIDFGENDEFTNVQMESKAQDPPIMMWILLVMLNPQSNKMLPLITIGIIIAVVGAAIIGAVYYYKIKRGKPPKPPTKPGRPPSAPQTLAQPMGEIICPDCGHVNPSEANFCEKCGSRIYTGT